MSEIETWGTPNVDPDYLAAIIGDEPPTNPPGRAGKSGNENTPDSYAKGREGEEREPWWANAVTGDVLDGLVFPPLTYLVETVLTVGSLTLLAGPPKAGKSYLAYGIACAVASGGIALGRLKVHSRADVLVVSLDDQSKPRAQRRLRDVAQGEPIPAGLTLHTEPNLGAGLSAAEALNDYLTAHPETRLVIVDTLEHLRGTPHAGENAYTADVRFLSQLRSVLTIHPNVSLLVLAHTRKGDDDDPVAAVSGTHGVTGGADAILVLSGKRGVPRRMLDVVSRDGEDTRLILSFGRHGLTVTDDDPNDPTVNLTVDDAKVYRAVEQFPNGASAKDVEQVVGFMPKIGNRLSRLADEGYLNRGNRGVYRTC